MKTRALEDKEVKEIFEHLSGRYKVRNRMMILLAIGMALRASELVGLKVGDLIEREGNLKRYVTIRAETAKFNKPRTIRIGDALGKEIAEFLEWKKERGESLSSLAPVFRSRKGGHLTRIALYQMVKKLFRKSGIEQSPHSLRKTGATLYYIESNYDLVATQLFLGHSSPSVTRRYIGLTPGQIVEYANKFSQKLLLLVKGETEINRLDDMLNSSLTVKDAVSFLNRQGFSVSLKPLTEKKAKIIKMKKSA